MSNLATYILKTYTYIFRHILGTNNVFNTQTIINMKIDAIGNI